MKPVSETSEDPGYRKFPSRNTGQRGLEKLALVGGLPHLVVGAVEVAADRPAVLLDRYPRGRLRAANGAERRLRNRAAV